MSRRWRTLRYGAAISLIIVGVACGATVPGTLGGTLATVLIGLGLVGVVSLVFYEVGLSEDRDRTQASEGRPVDGEQPRPPEKRRVRPGGIDRGRGEHRRLR